jgi:hypothetical protein
MLHNRMSERETVVELPWAQGQRGLRIAHVRTNEPMRRCTIPPPRGVSRRTMHAGCIDV